MTVLILDWYRCRKKGYDLSSLICGGRLAKAQWLGSLLSHLWRGQVTEVISLLEQYRPHTNNEAKLDELINYLRNRQPYLPNDRRVQRHYIGSAHVEKATI